jgi:hypothetical protein
VGLRKLDWPLAYSDKVWILLLPELGNIAQPICWSCSHGRGIALAEAPSGHGTIEKNVVWFIRGCWHRLSAIWRASDCIVEEVEVADNE